MGMKVEITVYKKSGKWYASEIVESEVDIKIFETERFEEFLRQHNPTTMREGFITVRDLGDGFHQGLWYCHKLYPNG